MDKIKYAIRKILIFINLTIASGSLILKIIDPIVVSYTEDIKKADIINFSIFTPLIMIILSLWVYKTIKPVIDHAGQIQNLSAIEVNALRRKTFNLPIVVAGQFLLVILSIVGFVAIPWDGYFYPFYPLYKRIISMFLIWSYTICMSMAVYIYTKQKLSPVLRMTSGVLNDTGIRLPIKTKVAVTTVTLSAMIFLFIGAYTYSQVREALHYKTGPQIVSNANMDQEGDHSPGRMNPFIARTLASRDGNERKGDTMKNMTLFLFTMGFFFILFSGYIGFFVAGDTSKSIKDIENEMIIISDEGGMMYRDIDVVSRDEVGDLTKTFNALQAAIYNNYRKLENANKKIAEMERNQIRQALEESKKKYLLLAENSTDIIWTMDVSDEKLTYISPSAEQLFGYSARDFLIKNFWKLFTPRSNDLMRKTLNSLSEDASKSVRDRIIELEMVRKDGTIVWTETKLTLLPGSDGSKDMLLAVTRDVSKRKIVEEKLIQSSDELRNLSAHLQKVREEERSRIAREIHDELGQLLTALKIDLELLKKRFLTSKESLDQSLSMSKLIDSAIQSVKRITTELRPSVLDSLGLSAAIEWQIGEFSERAGIKCEFVIDPDEIVLDKERSITIFRIFQEALTNILRHSRASEVIVQLLLKDDIIELSVSDNGIGIEEKELSKTMSFGLIGIRERVHYWQGDTDINGIPGKGTTLKVSIPLEISA